MGVAVDQSNTFGRVRDLTYSPIIHVHERGISSVGGIAPAFRAGLLREGFALAAWAGEEGALPFRCVRQRAEGLVGDIIGAEGIAVHEQGALAFDHDDGRVRQQGEPGATCVVFAQQEITVSVDEEARFASIPHGLHAFDEAAACLVFGVVADPGLKKIAEDVERVGVDSLLEDEPVERIEDVRSRDVEMQVGDEECRHARPLDLG